MEPRAAAAAAARPQGPVRACTQVPWPREAASCSAVRPARLVRSRRKPRRRKERTKNSSTAPWPHAAAHITGLLPAESVASGSPLNCTRSCTASKWPRSQARLSAVRPRSSRRFTAAPCSSSSRTKRERIAGSGSPTATISGVRPCSARQSMMLRSSASSTKRAKCTLPACMASRKVRVPARGHRSLGLSMAPAAAPRKSDARGRPCSLTPRGYGPGPDTGTALSKRRVGGCNQVSCSSRSGLPTARLPRRSQGVLLFLPGPPRLEVWAAGCFDSRSSSKLGLLNSWALFPVSDAPWSLVAWSNATHPHPGQPLLPC